MPDPMAGTPIPSHDSPSGIMRTHAWLILVMAGAIMVTFSIYMMLASIEQRSRIAQLIEQTRMLRESLAYDHAWQIEHHRSFEATERSIRAAVGRKEAMIRGALKKQFGWTDADIDAAIQAEAGNVSASDGAPERP